MFKQQHVLPELFVESAGYQASLEENLGGSVIVLLQRELKVLGPVFELEAFQRFDVEVRSLDGILELLNLLSFGFRVFENFSPFVNDLLLHGKVFFFGLDTPDGFPRSCFGVVVGLLLVISVEGRQHLFPQGQKIGGIEHFPGTVVLHEFSEHVELAGETLQSYEVQEELESVDSQLTIITDSKLAQKDGTTDLVDEA